MSEVITVNLDRLAHRINAAHQQFEESLRASLQHARTAGELLLKAKEQIPRGGWLSWLRGNCDVSNRMAQHYMRVARRWDELTKNETPVSHLPLREAILLLTDASEETSPDGEPGTERGRSPVGGKDRTDRGNNFLGDKGEAEERRLPHYNPGGWADHCEETRRPFEAEWKRLLREGPAEQLDKAVRKFRRKLIKALDVYCHNLLYEPVEKEEEE